MVHRKWTSLITFATQRKAGLSIGVLHQFFMCTCTSVQCRCHVMLIASMSFGSCQKKRKADCIPIDARKNS